VQAALVTLVVAALTLLPAMPASAHATLELTNPAADSVSQKAPTEVALTYDQPVSASFGAIKVLSPNGNRVDTGQLSTRDGGRTVVQALSANIPPGTYTILWRVLSADTHTVFGAVTFSVKTQTSSVASAAAAAQASAGAQTDNAMAVSRFILYAGLVLLIGGVAFLLLLWPAGRTVRSARAIPWLGWALAVLGSAGGLLIDGPYAAGQPLSSVFDVNLLAGVIGTRYGIATIIRLVLLVAGAAVLWGLPRANRRLLLGAAGVLSVGVLASTSAIGHAGSGDLDVIAWPADMLHLAAASGWLGGLALLVTVLLRRRQSVELPADLSVVLPRWSRYAAGCVAVLVITGTFAGWRQVRELGALTTTTYGLLLLIKLALVLVIVVLGAVGRAWVRRHYLRPVAQPDLAVAVPPESVLSGSAVATGPRGGRALPAGGQVDGLFVEPVGGSTATLVRPAPTSANVTGLRRGVLLEAVIATVVLGVTAVLVATTPAENSYFPVFNQSTAVAANLVLDVDVDPARTGLNGVHVSYTDKGGKPVDVQQVTARWTEESAGGYVVPVQLPNTSVGHYDLPRVELPAAGMWQLVVISQTSDVEALTTVFTVRIR
jgi:copper transport protein